MLLEDSTTNRWVWSSDFTHWVAQNVTLSGTTLAPDSVSQAQRVLTGTNPSGSMVLQQHRPALPGNTWVTVSAFAKPAGQTRVGFALWLGGSRNGGARYDLTGAGTADWCSPQPCTSSVQLLPNGWYRISMTALTDATGSGAGWDAMQFLGADWSPIFAGGGTTGMYLWGAQYEISARAPSSYIPTTSSVGARGKDMITP